MLRGGGAVKAGGGDQRPGLGRQVPGVSGQMKFRVSGQKSAYLVFIFRRFGGAGDVEKAAAGFQEAGGGLQHGLLTGGKGGQVAFPEPGLDLRMAPDYAQGRAWHVQDHRVQGSGFQGEPLGGVSPEWVNCGYAPAPGSTFKFLEAAAVAVYRHQQAGVAHGLGQVGGLAAPAGADFPQAQARFQGQQDRSQLGPFILEEPEPFGIRGQVRRRGVYRLEYETHRGKPAGPGLHPFCGQPIDERGWIGLQGVGVPAWKSATSVLLKGALEEGRRNRLMDSR